MRGSHFFGSPAEGAEREGRLGSGTEGGFPPSTPWGLGGNPGSFPIWRPDPCPSREGVGWGRLRRAGPGEVHQCDLYPWAFRGMTILIGAGQDLFRGL